MTNLKPRESIVSFATFEDTVRVDIMSCKIEFELPDWIYDIPFEEYCAIVNSCKQSATSSFYTKLDKIYEKRQQRLAAERVGQMNIYDYV